MNCDRCGHENAEVRFTEVVGSHKQVQWLCSKCAADGGLLSGHVLPAPISTTITVVATVQESRGSTANLRRRCPTCGTSLGTIRRSGRVGCASCYDTFREHLEPLLMRVHGCLEHLGRVRGDLKQPARARKELMRLRGDLARAVEDEDFEAAARLRDAIRHAEAGSARGEAER